MNKKGPNEDTTNSNNGRSYRSLKRRLRKQHVYSMIGSSQYAEGSKTKKYYLQYSMTTDNVVPTTSQAITTWQREAITSIVGSVMHSRHKIWEEETCPE